MTFPRGTLVRSSAAALAFLLSAVFAAAEEAPLQTGTASFYGPGFDGRKTANGEIFRMTERTAAHPSLPFGTMLRVRSLDSGLETIVRVNDRGPFVAGRIIDLSYKAAADIGMVERGTAKVALYIVGRGDAGPSEGVPITLPAPCVAKPVQPAAGGLPEPETPAGIRSGPSRDDGTISLPGTRPYAARKGDIVCKIQVASFSREANARELFDRLRYSGFTPSYEQARGNIRVVLDGIPETELDAVLTRLDGLGYRRLLVKKYQVL
ncbi:MAG: septal ring lytic transglycosylase RlpA family protein [Spirochaetes bacterium]|nr:septal ring lytic transglycosylase RlpA family protein [Spirochaetota bacterium]